MLTRDQIMKAREYHLVEPSGTRCHRWRRNGQTQIWKRREGFRIPVKHGLYDYGNITEGSSLERIYVAGECPVCGVR